MVKFIESELILLKKEVDEMWTLVYNQLDRAGEAVMTLDKELAQPVSLSAARNRCWMPICWPVCAWERCRQRFYRCWNWRNVP